jgi:hypothetical protein
VNCKTRSLNCVPFNYVHHFNCYGIPYGYQRYLNTNEIAFTSTIFVVLSLLEKFKILGLFYNKLDSNPRSLTENKMTDHLILCLTESRKWAAQSRNQVSIMDKGNTCILTWFRGFVRGLLEGFWIVWLDLLHLINSQLGTTGYYSAIADLHTLEFTVAHALEFSVFISRILATDLSQSHCHLKSHK